MSEAHGRPPTLLDAYLGTEYLGLKSSGRDSSSYGMFDQTEEPPVAREVPDAEPWAPTRAQSAAVFLALFLGKIARPLVTAMSSNGHKLEYSVAWFLFVQASLKLLAMLVALPIQRSFTNPEQSESLYWDGSSSDWKLFLLYSIPSILYVTSDLLYVATLVVMNPALSLPMRMAFRVIANSTFVHLLSFTAIGEGIFKPLNGVQWAGAMCLLIGVVLLTPFGVDDKDHSDDETDGNILLGVVLTIGYALCNTLGSLSTEVLLKRKSEKQSTTIQTIQLYTWMVVSSAAYVIGDLFANQTERNDFYSEGPFHNWSIWVWLMTFLAVVYGILASTALKYAGATALLLVNMLSNPTATMLCVPLFHVGMTRDYVLSFFTILVGVYMVRFASIRGDTSA